MASSKQVNLVAVRKSENPAAYQAWADWRKSEFGCDFLPKAYTVPSMFPPTSQEGADAYAEILRAWREAIGWHDSNIPRHPRPWGKLYLVSHETERP